MTYDKRKKNSPIKGTIPDTKLIFAKTPQNIEKCLSK
jgi:hypothetical protein